MNYSITEYGGRESSVETCGVGEINIVATEQILVPAYHVRCIAKTWGKVVYFWRT